MHGSLTNFTIAARLAVVFGLGWALGLAATSLPVKELTLTFFALHGVRNQDIRMLWTYYIIYMLCLPIYRTYHAFQLRLIVMDCWLQISSLFIH